MPEEICTPHHHLAHAPSLVARAAVAAHVKPWHSIHNFPYAPLIPLGKGPHLVDYRIALANHWALPLHLHTADLLVARRELYCRKLEFPGITYHHLLQILGIAQRMYL